MERGIKGYYTALEQERCSFCWKQQLHGSPLVESFFFYKDIILEATSGGGGAQRSFSQKYLVNPLVDNSTGYTCHDTGVRIFSWCPVTQTLHTLLTLLLGGNNASCGPCRNGKRTIVAFEGWNRAGVGN